MCTVRLEIRPYGRQLDHDSLDSYTFHPAVTRYEDPLTTDHAIVDFAPEAPSLPTPRPSWTGPFIPFNVCRRFMSVRGFKIDENDSFFRIAKQDDRTSPNEAGGAVLEPFPLIQYPSFHCLKFLYPYRCTHVSIIFR